MISFIKITDNNHLENFVIIHTYMKDCRIKMSMLKNQYKHHSRMSKSKNSRIFEIFDTIDYSYYSVYRGYFDSKQEIDDKKNELNQFYRDKINKRYNYTV